MAYIQNARFDTEKPVSPPALQIGYRGNANRQPVQQLSGLGAFEWGAAFSSLASGVISYKMANLERKKADSAARFECRP